MKAQTVSMSDIDTQRFGVKIARAHTVNMTNMDEILAYCGAHEVEMLIARCSTSDFDSVHEMQKHSFLLMDTLVYYDFNFQKSSIPEDTGKTTIRYSKLEDIAQAEAVARKSFTGYFGHYHADPRLENEKADEAYVSWLVRSIELREVAHEVLIAEIDGEVVGFITLRMNSPEESEIALNAVAPFAQGQGIYRSLVNQSLHWAQKQSSQRMIVSTQVNNIAVQKVWARLGFTLSRSFYTFHKWFDDQVE
jgi:GNAT superfamily N-acetyltransferase